MIEKILKEINRLKNELDGYSALEALDYIESYINTILREPANEDLERQYKSNMRYQHAYTQDDLMKTKSEGLEEEMIRWHKKHFGNKRDWGKTSGEYLTRKSQLDIARHFAEWQKQQMMKDVVEGLVGGHTDIPAFINLEIEHKPNVKVGDKVKIIILKTE